MQSIQAILHHNNRYLQEIQLRLLRLKARFSFVLMWCSLKASSELIRNRTIFAFRCSGCCSSQLIFFERVQTLHSPYFYETLVNCYVPTIPLKNCCSPISTLLYFLAPLHHLRIQLSLQIHCYFLLHEFLNPSKQSLEASFCFLWFSIHLDVFLSFESFQRTDQVYNVLTISKNWPISLVIWCSFWRFISRWSSQ